MTSGSPVLTSLEWLNPHDSIVTSTSSLLATGCNDGCVRVYKPNMEGKSSTLVTAWSVCGNGGSPSSSSNVSNLLMRYEPEGTRLVVSYHGTRSSHVCVWDVAQERMVREIGGREFVAKGETVGGGREFEWWATTLDCHRAGE